MPAKLTTERFISNASQKHNGKYVYGKTVVLDRCQPVIITCPIHGDFQQAPRDHIKGSGCPKCAIEKRKKSDSYTTQIFIEKAHKIHGNKYDYTKVNYINARKPVIITCPIHGDFQQTPCNHLKGTGCPHCKGLLRKKNSEMSKEDFFNEVSKKYENNIDFSLINYVSPFTPMEFTCKKHGVFRLTPSELLRKRGCPECGKQNKLIPHKKDTEQFIKESKYIHGEEYKYDKTVYVNNHKEVIITCRIHGNFSQKPSLHLRGGGCPICYGNNTYTNESFVKKANSVHHETYDYSQINYVNAHTPINIICTNHGMFPQKPYKHLNGQGCPKCAQSKLESSVNDILQQYKIIFEREKVFSEFGSYRYDFYIPNKNILIECQGEQHFIDIPFFSKKYSFKQRVKNDIIKYQYAQKKGYKIFYLIPSKKYSWNNKQFEGIYKKERIFFSSKKMIDYIMNQ
jgi:very-short-patch-repair endonuclease